MSLVVGFDPLFHKSLIFVVVVVVVVIFIMMAVGFYSIRTKTTFLSSYPRKNLRKTQKASS